MTIGHFRNFAANAVQPDGTGGDTVAHLANDRANRTLTGHVWQRLGTRTDAFKSLNIATRQEFVNALKAQFGVNRLLDIPPKILEQLNLDDFALDDNDRVMSDKPLTARRILRVTRAVDGLASLADRSGEFYRLARTALTPKFTREFIALVKTGKLGSAQALKEFVARHFDGDVGRKLMAVMAHSAADHRAFCNSVATAILAAVKPALVEAGITREQLNPVRAALQEFADAQAQGDNRLLSGLARTFGQKLDAGADEIAKDSFAARIGAKVAAIDGVTHRQINAGKRLSQLMRSNRGRDTMMRVAIDGLISLYGLNEQNRQHLDQLLAYLVRFPDELGKERVYILANHLSILAADGETSVNRMQTRQLLGTLLKHYTNLTDADLKLLGTQQLLDFVKAAADDSLAFDRETLTARAKAQIEEATRQNYTDAETRELMAFVREPVAAPPVPPAPPLPDPALDAAAQRKRNEAWAENRVVCDNLTLLGKLIHREDAWNADALGGERAVYDTLTKNRELVESLVHNWQNGKVSIELFSSATTAAMNYLVNPSCADGWWKKLTMIVPDRDNPFTGAINKINLAIKEFAAAPTEEARQAACAQIAANIDVLSQGLMDQVQRILTDNLNTALAGMGFGGNFTDLPPGQSPETADLLALAKARHPVPRNETTEQRKAREAAILADYAKLVVDPQAGGLGTLIRSLASNYVRQLDVREQRSMLSGALLAINPTTLTDLLGNNSVFGLASKAMTQKGRDEIGELFAPVAEGERGLTAEQKKMAGEVAGGILKGAGPVLQKMVQMLGVDNMPDFLRKAVKECKSELKPIPQEYVKAKLAELARQSKGKITVIGEPVSIGAASIAQAFRCRIRDERGRERNVVVKMLRPDVRGRMEREIEAIRNSVADAGEGALRTLNARINSLLAELDFTEERANIDACQPIYGQSPYTCLKSVKLAEGVPQLSDVLVMEEAKGTTFQSYMDGTKERLDALLDGRVRTDGEGHYQFTPVPANEQRQLDRALTTMYKDVRKRQANLQRLVQTWFSNALFGNGKFHGDLHGGNIMVDEQANVTVIDFGNAPVFSANDRKQVVKLVVAAARGKATAFIDAMKALVSDESKAVLERKRVEIRQALRDMYAVGSVANAAQRVTVAFGILARAGVEVPEAIYNFMEAFGRVQQLSDSMEQTLNRISGALPYLRQDAGDAPVNASRYAPLSAEQTERLGRTFEQHVDALFMREITKLRKDSPRISDKAAFEILSKRIRAGEFNRLFASHSRENPILTDVLALLCKALSPMPVVNEYINNSHADVSNGYPPDCPREVRGYCLTRIDQLLGPYLARNPNLAGAIDELKRVVESVYADGDFQDLDSHEFDFDVVGYLNDGPDGDGPFLFDYDREFVRLCNVGLSEERAAFIARGNTRFASVMRDRVLPELVKIFQTHVEGLADRFSLSTFAPPVSMKESMLESVLHHALRTVRLGGLGSVCLGFSIVKNSIFSGTVEIRGNFNVPLATFRAFASGEPGRIHARKDKTLERVDDRPALSVHNAEARRALVESLIEDQHTTAKAFYASVVGRRIAALLGLDEGETMDNVESAPPLTTELLQQVLAVYDMADLNRTEASIVPITEYFGRAPESVTAEEFMAAATQAFRVVAAGDNDRLAVWPDRLKTFAQQNYGKVLARLADIGAADPHHARTGAKPTPDDVKRWLVAALLEELRRAGLAGEGLGLEEVLGVDGAAFRARVSELRLDAASPVITALMLRYARQQAEAEEDIAFILSLGDPRRRPSMFRSEPRPEALEAEQDRRRALYPALGAEAPGRARQAQIESAERLGFGMAAIAGDNALYARFKANPGDPALYNEVKALVRKTIYVQNAKPELSEETETANLYAYWMARNNLENPPQAPADEVPEEAVEEEEPGFFGGVVAGVGNFLAGFFG